jgi:CHAT domain-containing protein
MDQAELAILLASSGDAERATQLERYAGCLDVGLARALKDLYTTCISGNPSLASGAAAAVAQLSTRVTDAETRALADWTRGMAALQLDHDLERAIALINAAAAQLDALGQYQTSAATQASKLFALAMLGRYEEAIACGARARDLLLAYGDLLAVGKIEQNLGNIYHRRDQYALAAQHYRAAREQFVALGEQRMLAFAENGLANVLALQHDFRAAAQYYKQALAHAVAANAEVTQAEIECNLGCMALFQGHYDQALDYLELSRRHYVALEMPHQSLLAELELADAYLELNLTVEAADIYSRITPILAQLGMHAEQARATAKHARACVLLGRLDEAQALAIEAHTLYRSEGNDVGAALAQLTWAQIHHAHGDFAAAEQIAGQTEAVFIALGAWGYVLLARWLQGEALRMMGHNQEARALLVTAVHDARLRSVPQVEGRCLTSLGLLDMAESDTISAEVSLKQAVALIEAMRGVLPADEFRTSFITDKLAPYTELARLCLADPSTNRVGEALDFVERARSRALLDMLRGEPYGRVEPRDQAEADLLTQLAAAHEELNWFYSQIHRLPNSDSPLNVTAMEELQRAAHAREMRLQELNRQFYQRGRAAPADTEALDLAALQRNLGPQTALIEYFSLDDDLLAFIVTDERIAVSDALGSKRQIAEALEQFRFQIAALRHGAGLQHTYSELLTRRVQYHLRTLHSLLLARFENQLGARNLIIAPHGSLYYVPFHALYDGSSYVIEQREVSYTPSAQMLLRTATRRHDLERAVLVGVPDARAPQLRGEIEALTPLFMNVTTLLGEQATLQALRESAPFANVLHLACHGEFRPDNPLFSALQLSDGRLTVRDVYELNLRCELAVLSACETGMSAIAPGDELLGLARGFLAAGIASLVVSLWAVDDEVTATLMHHFYQRLLMGDRPATALRDAQIAMLARSPHPFFWSPFILLGRP